MNIGKYDGIAQAGRLWKGDSVIGDRPRTTRLTGTAATAHVGSPLLGVFIPLIRSVYIMMLGGLGVSYDDASIRVGA